MSANANVHSMPRSQIISLGQAVIASHDYVVTPLAGFANITARCSLNDSHGYSVHLSIEDDVIVDIRYGLSQGKHRSASTPEVESAFNMVCLYLLGKPVARIDQFTCDDVLENARKQLPPLKAVREGNVTRFPMLGMPLEYVLKKAGGLAYVLVHWAYANFQIKAVLHHHKLLTNEGQVMLNGAEDVLLGMKLLNAIAIPRQLGRGLDIGLRSVNKRNIDHSILRSAYQRQSYAGLLQSAIAHGFNDAEEFRF